MGVKGGWGNGGWEDRGMGRWGDGMYGFNKLQSKIRFAGVKRVFWTDPVKMEEVIFLSY
jgi:hypothetical protein